ncbi:hypothetical protein [Amycolatopsis suaedae]|uniref:DUF8017 domain-containing protein n=1 Tax=Amycolatopsis suaedae TaxID=2510978 RepID=A0A4Q7JC35_9PSEU|nr:hypothetical protein [Amycolatopsis suaedae]RZQ64859.1 hypothetical protein EWH70_08240 [Amycolatopsis suaedae]
MPTGDEKKDDPSWVPPAEPPPPDLPPPPAPPPSKPSLGRRILDHPFKFGLPVIGVLLVIVIGSAVVGFTLLADRYRDIRSDRDTPSAQTGPVVAGWQATVSGDGRYAVDVPPNWAPEPRGREVPLTSGDGKIIRVDGAARLALGYCSNANQARAISGFDSVDDSSLTGDWDRSVGGVSNLLTSIYPPRTMALTVENSETVNLPGTDRSALRVTATLTRKGGPGECEPPAVRAIVTVLTHASRSDDVHIVVADAGVGGALSAEELTRLAGSLRVIR